MDPPSLSSDNSTDHLPHIGGMTKKVSLMRSAKGKEQGDALMPALFSLDLHAALCAVNRRLLPNERLLAFLDDIYALCRPERVSDVHVALQEELWAHSRIQVHQRKTQLWNRLGSPPSGWQALTAAARISDPEAVVWRGDPSLLLAEQGVKVLGTPLGHTEFLKAQLREVINSHSILWERIPSIPDLQSAWLLLVFCAATRANYLFRSVPPHAADEHARDHDDAMRRCISQLLDVEIPDESWAVASLPLSVGGLGLRKAISCSRRALLSRVRQV